MKKGNPRKLKDGSWGAWVFAPVVVGEQIQIETRSGKSWISIGSNIISSHDGGFIVSTKKDEPNISGVGGCWRCRKTPRRTVQLWEECDHCGSEPIYM